MKLLRMFEKHRDNLKAAKTWEEYRDAHINYIDMLIEIRKLELKIDDLKYRFVATHLEKLGGLDGESGDEQHEGNKDRDGESGDEQHWESFEESKGGDGD